MSEIPDSRPCDHEYKIRSRGWEHGFHQWICLDCDAVIDAPVPDGVVSQ